VEEIRFMPRFSQSIDDLEPVTNVSERQPGVKTPPADLSDAQLRAALAGTWNLHASTLEYVPLGFGSHHWIIEVGNGRRWFVTVDDLSAAHLAGNEMDAIDHLLVAFRTAAALRDIARLPFVVAPIAGHGNGVVLCIGGRYALSVFPFLEVAPTEYGEFRNAGDRDEALALIGQVHNATDCIPIDGLRQNTLDVPNESALLETLRSLDEPWRAGPFGEPARKLLVTKADDVRDRLRRLIALRGAVQADRSGWVVTHGETHASNIVRTRSGELVMVDWDTVALAPRERDMWNLVDERAPDWSPYAGVTGVTSLSTIAMDAYRNHWDLSEIAIYVEWCHSPHERTAEMEIAWEELQAYLAR
jgi:spectinomycin phosphotransferase